MQEYASVHCPKCGERLEVPMGVVVTYRNDHAIYATSKGQIDHACAGKTVAVDGR